MSFIIMGLTFLIVVVSIYVVCIPNWNGVPPDKHLSPEYKLNAMKRIIKNGLGEHTAQWLKGKEWIDIEDYDRDLPYLMLHSRNFGENERPKFNSKEHAENLIEDFNNMHEKFVKQKQFEVVVHDYDSEIGMENKIQEVLSYINNKNSNKTNEYEISYVDGELKIGSSCGGEFNIYIQI